jgi:tetratricopeptide (TPR) repeat protein
VSLDVLTPAQARDLFTARVGSDRVAAEPRAVDDILAGCAGLPLALAIAAARAVAQPRFPIAALADDLRGATTALDVLGLDDATDVRAVFTWSYRTLDPESAHLFRLLGLHPGPDLTVPAAASLAGTNVHRARAGLARLVRAHLVTEPAVGRYGLHDLLRVYAREQVAEHEDEERRRAALRRGLDHYLHTARPAALLMEPHRDQIAVPEPADGVATVRIDTAGQALDWFTRERLVLLNVVGRAIDEGFDAHAWRLTWAMTPFLQRHGYWADQIAIHGRALDAARRLGDPAAEGHVHRGLASAVAQLGRPDEGYAHNRTALRLFQRAGDRAAQARTHLSLAWLSELRGRVRDALDHARRARRLYAAIGHRVGLAQALNALGWYHALSGDLAECLIRCAQALELARQLDEREVQAWALDSLGYAHQRLGDHRRAIESYRESATLSAANDDPYSEGETLTRLGEALSAAGDARAANAAWRRAAELFDLLGHPDGDEVRARVFGDARVASTSG